MVSLSRVLELQQISQDDTGLWIPSWLDIDVQSELNVVRSGTRGGRIANKKRCLVCLSPLFCSTTTPFQVPRSSCVTRSFDYHPGLVSGLGGMWDGCSLQHITDVGIDGALLTCLLIHSMAATMHVLYVAKLQLKPCCFTVTGRVSRSAMSPH